MKEIIAALPLCVPKISCVVPFENMLNQTPLAGNVLPQIVIL